MPLFVNKRDTMERRWKVRSSKGIEASEVQEPFKARRMFE